MTPTGAPDARSGASPVSTPRKRDLGVGFGCKRGTPVEEIELLVLAALEDAGLAWDDIGIVATIDRRVREPGLVALARRSGAVLVGYPADALAAVPGLPTPSDEVERLVETPGVCEP